MGMRVCQNMSSGEYATVCEDWMPARKDGDVACKLVTVKLKLDHDEPHTGSVTPHAPAGPSSKLEVGPRHGGAGEE